MEDTEKEPNTEYDFLCERRLAKEDPALHKLYQSSVFAIDRLLASYKNVFPFFTDHTFEHSAQVINYANIAAGPEIVSKLSPDEIYILLMGAALHDVGMGISESDFYAFCDSVPGFAAYKKEHPDEVVAEYTRVFHHEFSAAFIRKYESLFEIPSPAHVEAIARIARGHRAADLLDEAAFPTDFPLPDGKKVNLAYLAALVKLADELDVTADRNLLFDYNQRNDKWSKKQTMCFKCHGAIKSLSVKGDALVLTYDTKEPDVEEEILHTKKKVEKTFAEYRAVVENRTAYKNHLREVRFEKIAPSD